MATNTFASLTDEAVKRPLAGQWPETWETDLTQVEVPLLSVGNWGNLGLHLRGNIEGYLDASSTQKWLRITVGDHIHPFYEPENIELEERFLGHFLKGEDTGWADEAPVMLAIRDGNDITWRGENEWPLARTEWTNYHLDAQARSLSPDAPASEAEVSYAALTETVVFSTPPFEAETEVTGPVVLRLWLSSSTTDADVFVRIGRVEPDGSEIWAAGPQENDVSIAQGWLRASHRKLDEKRTLTHRPFHAHDEVQPLEPGTPVALDIEIWPTSMVYPVGTTLILEVGGAELTHSHFVHDDLRDRPRDVFGGTTTVLTGPSHSSYLVLPVIPAGSWSARTPPHRGVRRQGRDGDRSRTRHRPGQCPGLRPPRRRHHRLRRPARRRRDAGGESRSSGAKACTCTPTSPTRPPWRRQWPKACGHFGRLDFAHNNAGIGPANAVLDIDEAEWDRVLGINLTGVFLCMKHQLPHLGRDPGAIVNTASMWGVAGAAGMAAYAASKHGVIGLTKSAAALECGTRGVRINAIAPGPIQTPLTAAVPTEVINHIIGRTAQQRYGQPDEVGEAVAWLCSASSSYVTGVVLPVDGGWLAA